MGRTMCDDSLSQGKFALNGKLVEIANLSQLSLNDYIRLYTSFKGTKQSCGEGGCGACSVIATSFNPSTDESTVKSINSCLAPLGSLDGVSITTVEALGNSKTGFSTVQEAFAKHHASQCGYCTPGFVVACHAVQEKAKKNGKKPTGHDFLQGMDGNLCRCTGYQPIIDACQETIDMEDFGAKTQAIPEYPEKLKLYLTERQKRSSASASLPKHDSSTGQTWITPTDLPSLFRTIQHFQGKSVQILAGNTASGVYHEWPEAETIIHLTQVKELTSIEETKEGYVFGAAVPFERIIDTLSKSEDGQKSPQAYLNIAAHLKRIAGSHVRCVATPGGNLSLLVNPKYYLESDFATVLMGAGGSVQLSTKKASRWLSMEEFLKPSVHEGLGSDQIITAVRFPKIKEGYVYWSQKIAQRFYNSHALVNLAVSYNKTQYGVENVKIAVGCPTLFREGPSCEARVAWQLRFCKEAAWILESGPQTAQTLIESLQAVQKDICPASNEDAPASYYRDVVEGLLLQAVGKLFLQGASSDLSQKILDASPLPPPKVPHGRQTYPSAPKQEGRHPVGLPIEKDRIHLQASGEAQYSSDIINKIQLFAAVVPSTRALAKIESIDPSKALELEGVSDFVGAKDIPGENKVFLLGGEAEIFASERTEYMDQPLGLIIATQPHIARKAAHLVDVKYSDIKEAHPVLSLEAGIQAGAFIDFPDGQSGHRHLGNIGEAFKQSKHTILKNSYGLPSQQHFYMETQAAVAEPQEGGTMLIHSSTQTLDGVQAAAARALGRPVHDVTAVCRRAGGGFGGKVSRSLPQAAAAAVAAHKVGAPVFYQLNRNEDFRMNGGRSETKIEYDVGFEENGQITALAVRGWFMSGADADLGWNDALILRDGPDQVYGIPNIDIDLKLVKTNLAPRTIMRSPGMINNTMVMEELMERVANYLGADPVKIRELNFLKGPGELSRPLTDSTGGRSPDGIVSCHNLSKRSESSNSEIEDRNSDKKQEDSSAQQKTLSRPVSADCWTLPRIWNGLLENSEFWKRRNEVKEFNDGNVWKKRGISINPCRFDAAPQPVTALVNIYYDGSLLVTHGGLEVGQGLSTKVKQMAVYGLSSILPENLGPLPISTIRINDSRTDITPAAGPTWSSTGSEASCAAVKKACEELLSYLKPAKESLIKDKALQDITSAQDYWRKIIGKVYDPASVGYSPATVPLSARGFFDGTETGGKKQMDYTSFGAAVSEVEIDVLTGDRRILRTDIHFDCGQSLNPMVDMGQVEGAFIQGLGMMTSEHVLVDDSTGKLITDSTWNYKPPTAACIPQQMFIDFLKDSPNKKGVMGSKASGEPSLLLTTSVLYALRNAVKAARESFKALQSTSRPNVDLTLRDSAPGNSSSDEENSPQRSHLEHTNSAELVDGLDTRCNDGFDKEEYFQFEAPATTVRLKQACGDISVSSLLSLLLHRTSSGDDSSSDWTHVV